jgi:hypothetical protein
MASAWVYVINDGSGTPRITRQSHSGITVVPEGIGRYLVTFPIRVAGLAAVATLNSSVGTVTAVPGESTGLSPNQVRVSTLGLNNQAVGAVDFSLAVFYRTGCLPMVAGVLGATVLGVIAALA